MADMPWRYWGLDLKEGTRLTLAALWRHARSSEREEYLHRGGRPVFVWPTVARLVVLTSRSLRAVETDLKLLREASLIVRAERVIGGRQLLGWESLSAWDMLVNEVDAWRRRRRDEREVATAVQARREREREEAEQLERRRMDPAEVARATARFTGMPQRDEHEQARRAGRAREADAARDDQAEQELRRQINAALLAARNANGGPLTAEQAEDIVDLREQAARVSAEIQEEAEAVEADPSPTNTLQN